MIGYCSWGQNSEIKQSCYDGTIGHLEKWVPVSERKKEVLKEQFFETRQWLFF